MSSWSNNSQFAFGVAAGVGAFFFASRGFELFSGFSRERSESNDGRDEARLDSPARDVGAQQLTAGNFNRGHTSTSDSLMTSDVDENQTRSAELMTLLYQIARSQASREGFVHRGITCNSCNASPICGTRFKCANCIDYDVCEVCEAEDLHNRTHVFLKIKYPIPPLANPKAVCLKTFYTVPPESQTVTQCCLLTHQPGFLFSNRRRQASMHSYNYTDAERSMKQRVVEVLQFQQERFIVYPKSNDVGKGENRSSLTQDETTTLKEKSHFGEVEIESLFELFKTLAPVDNGITREAFNQCLGPLGRQKNLVMDKMFQFYDQDRDGIISFEEFVCALSILVKGSKDEKLRYVFEGYDLDGKGFLTSEDFHQMFKAYFNVSIELVRDYIKTCEEEMKATFDETADKPVSSAFHAPIPNHEPAAGASGDLKSLYQLPGHSTTGSKSGAQPLMEAMSQDAIDEMVSNVFKNADLDNDGKITYEEFKAWAILDNTILNWFEALGTIF